jgi:hypothetical protein
MLKNNCPCEGSLYDVISIFDEDGKFIFSIHPAIGHDTQQPELWGYDNKTPLATGGLDGVYKFLGCAD